MNKVYWFVAGCISTYLAVRAPQIAIGLWKIPLERYQVWLAILFIILVSGLIFLIIEKYFVEKTSLECFICGHDLKIDFKGNNYCCVCGKDFPD